MCVNQEQTSLYYTPIHTKRFSYAYWLIRLLHAYTFSTTATTTTLLHIISISSFSVAVYFHYNIYIYYISIIYIISFTSTRREDKTYNTTMNCSVYPPSFLPYRNSHPHPLSSFRIDDILKTPTAISPAIIDPTALWSSFAAQILAYSPELLSVSTTAQPPLTSSSSSNDISPPIPNLISPQKHAHHRHQFHPYLSTSRHSPTSKHQHTLSPLSIKDKIQHQHIERKGMFK